MRAYSCFLFIRNKVIDQRKLFNVNEGEKKSREILFRYFIHVHDKIKKTHSSVTDDMQQVTFDKHEGYFAYLEKIYFKYVGIRLCF